MNTKTVGVEADGAKFLGGDRLLRVNEVADHLRTSPRTVRRMIDEGKLRSVKLRGLRLVRLSELNFYVEGAKA